MKFIRLLLVAALVGLSSVVAGVPAVADIGPSSVAPLPPWSGFRVGDMPTGWVNNPLVRAVMAGGFFTQPPDGSTLTRPLATGTFSGYPTGPPAAWDRGVMPWQWSVKLRPGHSGSDVVNGGASMVLLCQWESDASNLVVSTPQVTSYGFSLSQVAAAGGGVVDGYIDGRNCGSYAVPVGVYSSGAVLDAAGNHRPPFMYVGRDLSRWNQERVRICTTSATPSSYVVSDMFAGPCPVGRFFTGMGLRGGEGPVGQNARLGAFFFNSYSEDAIGSSSLWDECVGSQCGLGYVLEDGTVCAPGWGSDPDLGDNERLRCRAGELAKWATAECHYVKRSGSDVPWVSLTAGGVMPQGATDADCQKIADVAKEIIDSIPPDEPPDDPSAPVDLGPVVRAIEAVKDAVDAGTEAVNEARDAVVGELGRLFGPPAGVDFDVNLPGTNPFVGFFSSLGSVPAGSKIAAWQSKVGELGTGSAGGSCSCTGWAVTLPVVGSFTVGNTCVGPGHEWAKLSRKLSTAVISIGVGLMILNFLMQALGYSGLGREVGARVQLAEKSALAEARKGERS